jgi:hypothetical protein
LLGRFDKDLLQLFDFERFIVHQTIPFWARRALAEAGYHASDEGDSMTSLALQSGVVSGGADFKPKRTANKAKQSSRPAL